MDFKDIDQMFDSIMERIDTKAPLIKGAYDTLPLSQDHFLLNKSWQYFKERLKTIETQYEQQIKANHDEIDALKKEILVHKETTEELDRQNSFLKAFQESFVKSRHMDFIDFQKAQNNLTEVWEEERLKLESKIHALENECQKVAKGHDGVLKKHLDREKLLQQKIDELKNKIIMDAQRNNEQVKEYHTVLADKQDVIKNREQKNELLRQEVNRLNVHQHKLNEEITLWERRTDSLLEKLDSMQKELDGRHQIIEQLSFQIDTLKREKEEIRRNWQKEEASWRELWDRMHSLKKS